MYHREEREVLEEVDHMYANATRVPIYNKKKYEQKRIEDPFFSEIKSLLPKENFKVKRNLISIQKRIDVENKGLQMVEMLSNRGTGDPKLVRDVEQIISQMDQYDQSECFISIFVCKK